MKPHLSNTRNPIDFPKTEQAMTRQDEFKAELFDLLRRYKVEMSVVEETRGYCHEVTGINFWSYTQHDGEGNEIGGMIDLTVGRWENGKE